MSAGYSAIQWSRPKRLYDLVAVAAVAVYLAGFFVFSMLAAPACHATSAEVVILRALGSCAMILLHVILCIGPLCRLDRRFLPVLFNRRHLGVLTFFIALLHGVIAVGYYHGFGDINPLISLLSTNTGFGRLTTFPFQLLGLAALIILFFMAATSHDFWLKNLGARAWKTLHMLVYIAYALLIGHVALGALQSDRSPLLAGALGLGLFLIVALHLIAGRRERPHDRVTPAPSGAWVDVAAFDEIPESRGKTVCVQSSSGRERVAIFKHEGKVSAVTNLCAHQGGPLGEGKVIDGCITCPWHGWQYRPHDGCSPPPFEEKIRTYQIRVHAGRVLVNPESLPPGTPTTPAGPESPVRQPETVDV